MSPLTTAAGFTVVAVPGLPEFRPGDDLDGILGDALAGFLEDGDILAVTSKIVSKAEGRIVQETDRDDVIVSQTVRVVATRETDHGVTRIVENQLGLVLAAAGVDTSNAGEGEILLLPEDPDASARALCASLRERTGLQLGVIITDTLGRPWRNGQTDAAIGAAGVQVAEDLRGTTDTKGRVLEATIVATADELAAAAELVKGKATGVPVAIIRGLGHLVGDLDLPGARSLIRPANEDMFRVGSNEAWAEGYEAGVRSHEEDF